MDVRVTSGWIEEARRLRTDSRTEAWALGTAFSVPPALLTSQRKGHEQPGNRSKGQHLLQMHVKDWVAGYSLTLRTWDRRQAR